MGSEADESLPVHGPRIIQTFPRTLLIAEFQYFSFCDPVYLVGQE